MGVDISGVIEVKRFGKWEGLRSIDIYRNYDVFATLSGKANKIGIEPITQAKGMPDDASEDAKTELCYPMTKYNKSYLTLSELVNFDWDKVINIKGSLTYRQWLIWNENINVPGASLPDIMRGTDYHGTVMLTEEQARELKSRLDTAESDDGVIRISDELFKKLGIKKGISTELNRAYVIVEYQKTYREIAMWALEEEIEHMKSVSFEKDMSDVRMVFGYDS